MTSKKIKPYAVVPQELYVVREADRQLRQIVEDMGRPGYVLVSRQMGKTNLLLNAKREMDTPEDCFSYVDVSNLFDDLRSFFRNIVDTTLYCKESVFEDLIVSITESRSNTGTLQPHKEHELELRAILRRLPGKLIICLDEIDALTKVDYSDNVFSLIRSIYFSGRTNTPHFKRLTYILSGVADPSELIKNKAISPFNIGEKIYLEDFSVDETKQFLSQCDLNLSDEVIDRIYYWTSGNPRVTWDVCSSIENRIKDLVALNSLEVDAEVRSLYLKSFDLPPFDHVRTRVSLDKELRNAVTLMHYGKTISLSDKIKDKLYLAGISTPKQSDGSIKFRNRIMVESVSQKWIMDIEREQLTLQERAAEKLKLGFFSDAAELYQQFIDDNDDDQSNDELLNARLNIGFCRTQLQQFDDAIAMFDLCELGSSQEYSLKHFKAHWAGICHLCVQDYKSAIECFREVVYPSSDGPRGGFYYETCVNLASAISAENEAGLLEGQISSEIEALLLTVVDAKSDISKSISPSATVHIVFAAHYQLSRFYIAVGDLEKAIKSLEAAGEFANDESKYLLALERASLETKSDVKENILIKCVEEFLAAKVLLSVDNRLKPLNFGVSECAKLVLGLCRCSKNEEAARLLRYIDLSGALQPVTAWELSTKALMSALADNDYSSVPDLIKLSIPYRSQSTLQDYHQCLILGLLTIDPSDNNSFSKLFVEDFLNSERYSLHIHDFRIIVDIVFLASRNGDFAQAIHVLDLAESAFQRFVTEGSNEDNVLNSGALCLIHLRLRMMVTGGDDKPLKPILIEYLPEIHKASEFSLPYFPEGYGQFLMKEFRRLIEPEFFGEITRAKVKIGRNQQVTVKFADGRQESGKYKKFAEQINSLQCEVVTVTP